jgi:hypothetical protein
MPLFEDDWPIGVEPAVLVHEGCAHSSHRLPRIDEVLCYLRYTLLHTAIYCAIPFAYSTQRVSYWILELESAFPPASERGILETPPIETDAR